jgi:thioredoxin-related protein
MKRRKSCVMFKEVEECSDSENVEENLCRYHEELQALNYEDREFKLRLKEEMDNIQLRIQSMNNHIFTTEQASKVNQNKAKTVEL